MIGIELSDSPVVRRHLAALREVLASLRCHSGATPQMLRADTDLRSSPVPCRSIPV